MRRRAFWVPGRWWTRPALTHRREECTPELAENTAHPGIGRAPRAAMARAWPPPPSRAAAQPGNAHREGRAARPPAPALLRRGVRRLGARLPLPAGRPGGRAARLRGPSTSPLTLTNGLVLTHPPPLHPLSRAPRRPAHACIPHARRVVCVCCVRCPARRVCVLVCSPSPAPAAGERELPARAPAPASTIRPSLIVSAAHAAP